METSISDKEHSQDCRVSAGFNEDAAKTDEV